MVKNIFLTSIATLILAAATVPVGSTAAMACHGCYKAAHLSTMNERHAYRKECRAHRKAAKKA